MREAILRALQSHSEIVSGETLSRRLGVSRVSVWKHIRALQDLGYPVESTPKGYRLRGGSDALYPWEFPERDSRIHYFPEAASTMDLARDMARKGCPHLTVVIAGRQSKGRGRLKRVWLSSEGGLYFTLVLRPEIPAALTPRINFLASLVLAKTLQGLYAVDAKVKWPNDILVGGKKIAGMLSEMEAEAEIATFVNIGIGVNVNNDPSVREPGAVSLKKLKRKECSRRDLLARFLDEFENQLDRVSIENVIPEWKHHTLTLGRPVKIVTTRETVEGLAVDVDENGALIVKLADGSLKKIVCGDCFHSNGS